MRTNIYFIKNRNVNYTQFDVKNIKKEKKTDTLFLKNLKTNKNINKLKKKNKMLMCCQSVNEVRLKFALIVT